MRGKFYDNMEAVATFGMSLSFSLIATKIVNAEETSLHGRFKLLTVCIVVATGFLPFMFALNS